MTTDFSPFSDDSAYALGGGITLSIVEEHEAIVLGSMIASMEPWAGYPYPPEALIRFLGQSETGAPRYAIRSDGILCGALTVRTNWFRGPYIQLLALAPTAQGRGLGARLLALVASEARRGRDRNVWVAATSTNTDAIRFYERHGFQRTAAIEGLVSDDHTEVLLRLRLRY